MTDNRDTTLQERARNYVSAFPETPRLMLEMADALDAKDAELSRLRATVERVEKLCLDGYPDSIDNALVVEVADLRAALTEGASDK